MEHSKAKKIAEEIVKLLSPYCDKIEIAGSIRRNKPEVGDIEIVAIPKIESPEDLFGDGEKNRSGDFIRILSLLGHHKSGKLEDGRQVKIDLPEGIMLDLYIPEGYDWGRIFAIRTGSGEYSRAIIARGWLNVGWCGTEDGLRRLEECEKKYEKKWVCIVDNPTLPPAFDTEESFFEFIGVECISPEQRNV